MISMIASIGKKGELGKNNGLIWHIPDDMKFFKNTTLGHVVVMGKMTYLSLPGKLVNRKMVVLCNDGSIEENEDIEIVQDIDTIINRYLHSEEEVFIIGGGSLYKQFLPYSTRLYLTEILEEDKDADTYFPEFNKNDWNMKIVQDGKYENIDYQMCIYTKKII